MPREGKRERRARWQVMPEAVAYVRMKRELVVAFLWSRQAGRCPICERQLDDLAVVDHDHMTGNIRGLLCRSCSLGLGAFRDDPNLLGRARNYVIYNVEPVVLPLPVSGSLAEDIGSDELTGGESDGKRPI